MLLTETTTEQVFKHLSKEHTNLLLVAEDAELDVQALLAQCNEAGITIAGGIFPMVIHGVHTYSYGCVLKVLPGFAQAHLIQNMGRGASSLPELPAQAKACIVLADGLSPRIPTFLGDLNEKYWNQISYVGGGAGSLSLKQQPCVFTNEGLFQDAGLVLFTGYQAKLGVKHGWQKIAGPFIANKTEGNTIIELNWRPAFEVYKEVVEQHTDQRFGNDNFFNIAKGFPFGIYRDSQEDIVRDPITVTEQGALVCVGEVPTNVSLNILMGNVDQLINNASQAAQQASHYKTTDLLISDCISRILYLGNEFGKELEAVKQALGGNAPEPEGMLSIGEVSSGVNGYLEFYNKTIVVSSFY